MEAVQINENLNLRGQKSTGILIGYVLTLALMFCAFEYTQRDPEKVIEEEKIYDMASVLLVLPKKVIFYI